MQLESFKQLNVWQRSIELVKEIYKATDNFPKSELYGLTNQMRRASISIASNIAEGYKRKNRGEYIQFLSIADASSAELETQVIITEDVYNKIDFSKAKSLLEEVQKMLISLIRKLNPQPSTLNPRSGFTMVELLVAMSIFSIIISVSSGVFVRSLQTQRATIALIAANSNASLAIEQMTREMRTGSGFSGGGSSITFINSKKETVTYRWNSGSEAMALERSVDGINFRRITSDNVSVKNLNFIVFSGTPSDPYPWRITIVFRVGVKNKLVEGASVDLQTTVSSRVL